MSIKAALDWCARVLAIGAIALVGRSVDAEATTTDGTLSQGTFLSVIQGDISVGYVVAGDVDSDGGGNPPKPE